MTTGRRDQEGEEAPTQRATHRRGRTGAEQAHRRSGEPQGARAQGRSQARRRNRGRSRRGVGVDFAGAQGAVLQEDHQRVHGGAGAGAVLHQDLAHLRRRDLDAASQELLHRGEEAVAVHQQVVEHQRLERRERAIRHVDVQVHAARAQQRVVQLLDVVCGEDEDAFVAAARPQPVGEVEQARQRDAPPVPLPRLFCRVCPVRCFGVGRCCASGARAVR